MNQSRKLIKMSIFSFSQVTASFSEAIKTVTLGTIKDTIPWLKHGQSLPLLKARENNNYHVFKMTQEMRASLYSERRQRR